MMGTYLPEISTESSKHFKKIVHQVGSVYKIIQERCVTFGYEVREVEQNMIFVC